MLLHSNANNASSAHVIDRLLNDVELRRRKLNDARKCKQEFEAQEFSFRPTLVAKSPAITGTKPTRKNRVMEEKPTFSPKLATSSYVSALTGGDNSTNVHERLFEKGTKSIRDVEEKVS